jgi:hypothetical protein
MYLSLTAFEIFGTKTTTQNYKKNNFLPLLLYSKPLKQIK